MQSPESWLNHNRYAYCMQNPVMYTDPDGEWVHILVGAVMGGAINLAMNWDNTQGFWQGFTSFVIGAGAGASVAATFGASLGVFLGVSAASSAVTMATNNVIAQTGENFSGMSDVNWGNVGISAGLGMVTGFVSSASGYGINQLVGKFIFNGWNVNSPAVRGFLSGAIGGGGAGYASGFTMGMITTGDFKEARDAGFQGMWKGALWGGGSGLAGSAIWARQNGVNLWTGEKLLKPAYGPDNLVADNGGSYSVYQGVDRQTGEVKYVGITKRDPQVRFNEHLCSNSPRADLKYNVIDGATGLSKTNARIWEQTLINRMGGPGNNNYNRINSIAPKYWPIYNIK